MKITKAKLKQIISEELSSMSEGGAQGHYGGEPEAADPVVDYITHLEQVGNMIRDMHPGEYVEHLETFDKIHAILKGMQTGAGNEVAAAQQIPQ
jgi:hypothetical protein